jgi:hypothetical protein
VIAGTPHRALPDAYVTAFINDVLASTEIPFQVPMSLRSRVPGLKVNSLKSAACG